MCSRALTHPLWKCTLLSYSWLTYLFFWQHESSNCHRRTVLISFILMVVWSHVWETCGHSFNSVSTSVKATVTIGGATLCALCIDITVQFELDLVRYNRQLNSPAQLAPREKHNWVSFKKSKSALKKKKRERSVWWNPTVHNPWDATVVAVFFCFWILF